MSISPDNLNLYQCVFSTSALHPPVLPFSSLKGEENTSRYALMNDDDILKPFAQLGEKKYYQIIVVDTKPEERFSLDENLEKVTEFDKQSLIEAGIPGLAFPYLTLTEHAPIVPDLFDAWQDSHQQEFVIIAQKDENWQNFHSYLSTGDANTNDVYEHLQKIAKLWKSFLKFKCAQSLLHLDNLGINNGQLEINKLYFDHPDNPPLLRQLVESWAIVLEQTQRPEAEAMGEVMMQVENGEIDDIKQLRATLDALTEEAQYNFFTGDSEDQEFLIPPEDELNELTSQFDFDESDDEGEATMINETADIDEQPTVVLPMRLLSLNDSGVSDIGMKRGHNEDCFAIDTSIQTRETPQGVHCNAKGLFIVCDGMGGHAGGEVASALAVKTLYNFFRNNWGDELPTPEVINTGIYKANQAIYQANLAKGTMGAGRMGTTLVMTMIQGTKVAVAHVGDSRIYRVTRKWGLEQLTVDHSVAQAEIKQGIESQMAFSRPDAYQLTQALGPRDNSFVNPDINYLEVKEDTLFLLCSDGLSDNNLLENNWQNVLLPLISSKANLDEGAGHLIDLANQVNGHDNITCVLARVKVQPNLEQKNPIL
ncbi:MAG: serine/threonine phosphatase [Cyanobacterium sp. T60_A2020_053]|nr:serine/threonine phosphatase [Cyanobacterium sp. T60_A2020_053]